MPADLLARIAKALEDHEQVRLTGRVTLRHEEHFARIARQLLPEAHEALRIAVEALEIIAGTNGTHCARPRDRAAEALSRLASTPDEKAAEPKPVCSSCNGSRRIRYVPEKTLYFEPDPPGYE